MTIRTVLIATALAILATGQAVASAKTDVVATIQQWLDAFNGGELVPASCSSVESLVDDIPPHEWHGSGACAAWAKDYAAWATAHAVTGGSVKLGKVHHIQVDGQTAYVVVSTSFSGTMKEKPFNMKGLVTVALKKAESGWMITGWAWAEQ
jgi:ketosteroid isomerase-like protein